MGKFSANNRKKVLILDTSVLCVFLQIPGKETCGIGNDVLTYEKVSVKINQAIKENRTTFILPLASIIETGNHITHANGDKHQLVSSFIKIIYDSIDEKKPWAAFTKQNDLWTEEKIKPILENWKRTSVTGQPLGDALIVSVAAYYFEAGYEVEIFTGDTGLKAYEPKREEVYPLPRRRR